MQKPGTPHLDIVAGALLGIAMLLLLRRYWGIDHDAALYLGQALRYRFPDILDRDLFFAYGGQSRFTLFPWLLAQSTRIFDVPAVFLGGPLFGMLLFAAACWYCLRMLLPAGQRYWAWLGVLCLPPLYGWTGIFSYNEPFLTPRLPAEALCLLGIGLLARRKWMPALACAVAAGLLHPLPTVAALLVVWPWLAIQDRRWLHAAWLIFPIVLLAFAGISPFDGLFRQLDAAWFSELYSSTRQIFLTSWNSGDYEIMLLDVLALGYAWCALRGPFGTWCAAALAGLALGLVANLILVDALHLVLPAQLQMWRVHWLAHWFAIASIACLLYRDMQSRSRTKALLLTLTCILTWGTSGWSWLVFALLYGALSWHPHLLRPRLQRLLGWLFALGILALFGLYSATEWLQFRQAGYRLDIQPFDNVLLLFPVISLGLPLLGLSMWKRTTRQGKWLLFACLLSPALAVAATRWDARSNMLRAVEQNAFRPGLFGNELPEDAQVFWDKLSVIGPWLILNRADYYSPQQLSGLVFSRGTAIEGQLRRERLQPLLDESLRCQDDRLSRQERQRCSISDTSLRLACVPGAIPPPDYLVLPYRQRQPPIGSWTSVDPLTGETTITYWLYACSDIMGAPVRAKDR